MNNTIKAVFYITEQYKKRKIIETQQKINKEAHVFKTILYILKVIFQVYGKRKFHWKVS